MTSNNEDVGGALAGMRVVDASGGTGGGYCTKLLAGLGADVIKIEPPVVGDVLRRAGPFLADVPHVETSAPHLHLATGKRSITLDIRTPSGTALIDRLLATADVLVLDGRAPAPELAPDRVLARFPNLIVTSITPHGAGGPAANVRTTDIVAMALSGYLAMTGDRDREPVKPYGAQSEYQAGLHAALGVLAALTAHDSVGGQHVDASSVEAAAFLTGGAVARAVAFERESVRNGTRPVGLPPEYLYPSVVRPCAGGGYIYVHRHNRFPDLLAALMQEPRLAAPELLASPLGYADETDALIDRWLSSRDKWRAVAEAQELRVPFTEVLDPGEVMADRLGQHTARGFFAPAGPTIAGSIRQPGAPVHMSATPWSIARAPLHGEHNVAVYCDELGLSHRDLSRLSAAGVI
jgi:crotonobetainyl-CoA:carnitine CoA-transferase CaiB-like acyl-CoA transferase